MTEKYKTLLKTNKTNEEISGFCRWVNTSYNDAMFLVCRGEKMRTWKGFSDEVSAVLQFPYYYSGVSASLHECIRDLDWMPPKRIFVFITKTEQILSDERPYDFLHFFEDSSIEVPLDSMKYNNEKRNVYYIFQNIDKDISEYP